MARPNCRPPSEKLRRRAEWWDFAGGRTSGVWQLALFQARFLLLLPWRGLGRMKLEWWGGLSQATGRVLVRRSGGWTHARFPSRALGGSDWTL